jgi:hypothetical protein
MQARPLSHVELVDETLREGDARGYHEHPPEVRAALVRRIHEIAGINEFSLGMAVVNANEHATLTQLLEARRRGLLPDSFRVHVYGWLQIHDQCQRFFETISAEDRACVWFDMAINTSDTLSRSQDIPWLKAHGWLKSAGDTVPTEQLLEARTAAFTDALGRYTGLGLSGMHWLLQDGFRSSETELDACIAAGIAGGGAGVRLHDSVGIATPPTVTTRLEHLAQRFPTTRIQVHFHDDFGMATANTITGLLMGAAGADVTVNGIGNRAGNAVTQEVLMALRVIFGTSLPGVQYTRLTELAELVERHFAIARSPHSPITGPILHLDESSPRTHLLHSDATTWHPYDPRDVGATLEAAHSPSSGRLAIVLTLRRAAEALATSGVIVDQDLIDRALSWANRERRARAERFRPQALAALRTYQETLRASYFTDDDLVEAAKRTKGMFDS